MMWFKSAVNDWLDYVIIRYGLSAFSVNMQFYEHCIASRRTDGHDLIISQHIDWRRTVESHKDMYSVVVYIAR